MRMLHLTFAAAGLALAAMATPAAAYDYPYCLQGRQTGIPGECSYASYQQCAAAASGRDAFCNINPRVAFGQARGERQYRRGQRPRAYDEWN